MFTMTTDRLRLLRRVALFGGVGLVVFVVALYFSFPYERGYERGRKYYQQLCDESNAA